MRGSRREFFPREHAESMPFKNARPQQKNENPVESKVVWRLLFCSKGDEMSDFFEYDEFSELERPDVDGLLSPSMETGEGWAVILYDDPYHLREELVRQLMKALRCDIDLADGIVGRVERLRKTIVIIANHREAKRVQRVLKDIQLITEIRKIG